MAINEPERALSIIAPFAGSLNLFSETETNALPRIERFARLCAELLHYSQVWIDSPGRLSARFPSGASKNPESDDLREALDNFFPGGIPRELTILPDLTKIDDLWPNVASVRSLVAAPLVSSTGAVLGVVCAMDEKPRRPTAAQIDSFKDMVVLMSDEIERAAPLEIPYQISISKAPDLSSILLDQCQSPAWIVDPVSGAFLAVNDAAVEKFGYSREEFWVMTTADLIADAHDRSPAGSNDQQPQVTYRSKEKVLVESEVITFDVVFNGASAKLEILRDIGNWKRIEERARFQSNVLSQISDAVIAVDLNHRITYWNHIAEQMYEYKSREVMGERLPDLLQPVWGSEREERDASTSLLSQGRWTGETVHHRRSGEMLHVESSVTAIKDKDNRQIGFLCLNCDITERKKMEKTLQVSEQRYRSLFDFHPDSVVWVDLDGKFLSANLACRTTFGYMPDDLIGKSFLPLVDPKDRVKVLDIFQRATSGEPVSYEYTGLNKDGRKVSLSAVALPVIVDGQIVGVYCIAQDIGERKRLQSIIGGENEVLQWLAANRPLVSVIDRLIGHIEQRYDAVKLAVRVFTEEMHTNVVTAPGLPPAALKIMASFDSLPVKTTVAKAVLTKQRSICKSLAQDSSCEDQREVARLASAQAAFTTPIIGTAGKVIGTLTFYLREAREPLAEELNVADRAAALLRIAIETDRAHMKLSWNERAMDSTVASVLITDPRKKDRPIIYANKAFERNTGYRAEDVFGRGMSILHGSETDEGQLREIEEAIRHEREFNCLIKYYTSEGKPYWSSSSISPVRDTMGVVTHFIEVQNDVTTLMEALDAVRESEQRFRQLIENASDMVLVLEELGTIRYASPAMERVIGYSPDDVRARSVFEFIHPDDLVACRNVFLELIREPDELSLLEVRILRKDGSWCHIEATGQNLINKPGVRGIVVNARDLSERKLANDRLDHLAYHDPLTDLPNRLLFNDHLTKFIANAKRSGSVVAVLFLDLDRFKVINDTLGHTVGDELLAQVGKRLTTTAREGDIVARWGGDEFTLILSTISNSRDAARAATRIINSLSEQFLIAGHELYITATVGISMFPAAGDDVETLVRNADTAMYRAKSEGQNHYQFYTPKMNAGAGERLALEGRLRRALEREEFELYYQPQVESKSGRIVGAEALVRWQHPELGLVSPKDFIPLAEETGLIVPIGEWIMQQACRQAKIWQDGGFDSLRIAVNLSARQFSQRDLQPMIVKIMRETGVDPTWLELELTESMLINCENRVINTMKELTASGIAVTIDDFGVGYSSYSYLKRYPVSALKIEQSFIRGMLTDAHDNAIVHSVIAMAHKLNLRVIAEGIETKEQSAALIASQCDFLQGYFYGKPSPAEDFTRFLIKQQAELKPSVRG